MIRRLLIKNFLSFKEVDLELGQRNVLVGPNMSGKSNLLAALLFLSKAANPAGASTAPLQTAVDQQGGFRDVIWKGSNNPSCEFHLIVEAPSDGVRKTYEYNLCLGGQFNSGRVFVTSEQLNVRSAETSPRVVLELKNGDGKWMQTPGSEPQPVRLPGRDRLGIEVINVPGFEGTTFKELLLYWRFYRLVPLLMKSPNPATPQPYLVDVGNNLSSWLMTLQTHPENFKQIRQIAIDVFPNLEEILIQPTQAGTIALGASEKHLKTAISLQHMSDGELAFLALVSMILAPEELGAPLYCLEEPENHLHPQLLETLVELLNQRQEELGARAAQIIATTHSPHLVDKFGIDDLVVVEKADGATRFTRPASDLKLKELLSRKDLGLGDLWYSGALRGA